MSSETDKILDRGLLLYAFKKASPVFGRLKAQKAIFLIEFDLAGANLPTPHYTFRRHYHGPYSQKVWDDSDKLSERGLMTRALVPTERGRFIIDLTISALMRFPRNREMFRCIDERLTWCQPKTGEFLRAYTYGLEVVSGGRPKTIRELPNGTPIITPQSGGLDIDPDDLEVIREQISVTPAQLRRVRADRRIIGDDVLNRLCAAANVGRP